MMINQIVIQDFGVFGGENIFELTTYPRKKKPIVLFGGKNGSGKTTIFDAIKICLYGQSFNGKRTLNDYLDYIKSRFHHLRDKSKKASPLISIEFEQTTLSSIDKYRITRSWQMNDASEPSEKLEITKNGSMLKDLDSENWQNFIREIMPPGITQLFFFDGEKIQHLADDKTTNTELNDSIKMMLGLDLVDKLHADLSIYKSKKILSVSDENSRKQLAQLKKESELAQTAQEHLAQERAHLETVKLKLTKDIERQEKKISDEAGGYSSKRNEIKETISAASAEINILENDLRAQAAEIAPFVLVPSIANKLLDRINDEALTQENVVVRKKINEKLDRLLKEKDMGSSLKRLGIGGDKLSGLHSLLCELFDAKQSKQDEKIVIVHGFSKNQYNETKNILENAKNCVKSSLLDKTKCLENLYQKRLELETLLNKAPSDDIIGPLMSKLSELNQELGINIRSIQKIEEEMGQVQFKSATILRNIKKVEEEIEMSQDKDRVLSRLNESIDLMKDYSVELKMRKLRELEVKLLDSFKRLIRKKDFITKIEINDNDFSIVLHKIDGKTINKEDLSAGEKQIFAISLLWALTQVSNRKLPFVIDTPLGRLDSDHRSKLVDNFFPNCGDQVIILSTDTEIDQEYFDVIKPNISSAYHLSYNHEKGATDVSEKYFWN